MIQDTCQSVNSQDPQGPPLLAVANAKSGLLFLWEYLLGIYFQKETRCCVDMLCALQAHVCTSFSLAQGPLPCSLFSVNPEPFAQVSA